MRLGRNNGGGRKEAWAVGEHQGISEGLSKIILLGGKFGSTEKNFK